MTPELIAAIVALLGALTAFLKSNADKIVYNIVEAVS